MWKKSNFLEAEGFAFLLLFVLKSKDLVSYSILQDVLGVFTVVVCWCSYPCYVCKLFGS